MTAKQAKYIREQIAQNKEAEALSLFTKDGLKQKLWKIDNEKFIKEVFDQYDKELARVGVGKVKDVYEKVISTILEEKYKVFFQKECTGFNHEYSTVAITNTTLDAVIEAARKYPAYCGFRGCFNNGEEQCGIVTFTAYRENPDDVSEFFSKHLSNSVVYADMGWDCHEVCIKKNGKKYDGFTARWEDKEPEGYREEWEEDKDAEMYYDCDVILTDNDTGYEFRTGGGMCHENEFEEFCRIIKNHPVLEQGKEERE